MLLAVFRAEDIDAQVMADEVASNEQHADDHRDEMSIVNGKNSLVSDESTRPIRPPLTPVVAAQRVVVGYLDEDERDAVGVGDVHFVQPPRLLAGFPADRHSFGCQLVLGDV